MIDEGPDLPADWSDVVHLATDVLDWRRDAERARCEANGEPDVEAMLYDMLSHSAERIMPTMPGGHSRRDRGLVRFYQYELARVYLQQWTARPHPTGCTCPTCAGERPPIVLTFARKP